MINPETNFETTVLSTFHYQAAKTGVYREYLSMLNILPSLVTSMEKIPFLPISFFKTRKIITDDTIEEIVFTSSNTTGAGESKHYVSDVKLYENAFLQTFRYFYGEPGDFCILALLPSYLEREGSSLVYMCNKLIQLSGGESGFFLNEYDTLTAIIKQNESRKQKTILFGVSYALLDLAGKWDKTPLQHTIIMETGGMKGRRKELLKEELHNILISSFGVSHIHSEYGMTELLSQAYSKGSGIYQSPPWMKVLVRDVNDPLELITEENKTGGINIIDLANINSCSFIATDDLGKVGEDGSFEILGRLDSSDVRGCNLLIG